MDDRSNDRSGFFARTVADPLQLRQRSWVALIVLTLLVVAGQVFSGFGAGMLTALCWACAPIVALGIGVGNAFFIRHGQQQRRIFLSIIVSIIIVLVSCVILAGISDTASSRGRNIVEGSLYGVLYAGIIIGLAGLIGLGIGRGEGYVSRQIDQMSDEDW